jgi:hypothetical protein
MNSELERIWKKDIMAAFEVLFQLLTRGTEEMDENLRIIVLSLGQELNQVHRRLNGLNVQFWG